MMILDSGLFFGHPVHNAICKAALGN